jgi:type I restriction enzyme S subunit
MTVVELGDICRPKQWPTLSKKELTDNGFPVYGANGKIGFYGSYTHQEPTLLIGCRGSCGSVHITEPYSYANGNAMALDDLNQDRADIKYLYHLFIRRGFRDVITGTSQPQIIQQHIRSIEIPLPPLEEQRRIAAILDKANRLQHLNERASKLHESLLDTHFLSTIGDPTKDSWAASQRGTNRLAEVATIRTGKLDANAAVPDGPFPFFTCSRNTLTIDSYCFDGEAVLVAGNGDLNVKRYSGKLNAYQRTYIISPKDGKPATADYIYSLLRIYVAKLRDLSIGGVIKYIKLPFLADLLVGPLDSHRAVEISRIKCKLSASANLLAQSTSMQMELASSMARRMLEI